jgi:hypothetical protein
MLGEKIGEVKGKITSQRVLDVEAPTVTSEGIKKEVVGWFVYLFPVQYFASFLINSVQPFS